MSSESLMMRSRLMLGAAFLTAISVGGTGPVAAQKKAPEVIPHGQSQPPGPPLTPAEAIRKMQVPPGFSVELVAAEPDLVNPVAMCFDEKGRIWVTESIEYPRQSAGPGKDRIKILEDTDGDGKFDKVTVFADGLNIPSGIAVGHGGVWVANSPDILFYKIGPDGKAAGKPEVVVTGFGRADTHELPNSLTWGPDGWLYGLNGVFNPCHVKQNGREWKFTCAMFRIHPRTKEFQVFCEGTSNPWGIAFDTEGSAFVSACVVDHLWHLTETGYYLRQGGPYPPFTWKIDSIVKHRHQKAAYCGLCFYDSDAYPEEYRGKLYMGNIHGGCINSDELTRDGSTYFAKPRPDFLTANDAWFMPVAQKTGPDGCLYILDWYDRYHCYQDAGRDPEGIDRLRGRLYRVRYQNTPRAPKIDVSKETDDQLIERLHSPNGFFRDTALRLLTERLATDKRSETRQKLEALALQQETPRRTRLHALWALIGAGPLSAAFQDRLLGDNDPTFRAWAVRAAGNFPNENPPLRSRILTLARDSSPDVQLQVAIAARKLDPQKALPILVEVLAHCGNDKLIPHIVWQNLHPLLEDHGEEFLREVTKIDLPAAPAAASLLPRVVERILASHKPQPQTVAGLMKYLGEAKGDRAACAQCLAMLASKVQTGELSGPTLNALRDDLLPTLTKFTGAPNTTLAVEASLLAATLQDPDGLKAARQYFTSAKEPDAVRLKALAALVAARDPSVLDGVADMLSHSKTTSSQFRGKVLAGLGKLDQPKVAQVVLKHFPNMEPELQPRAIDLLTERPVWSKLLLSEIGDKKIAPGALNVNQVRKLLASKDAELLKQVKAVWGSLREDRNPEREKVVAQMRALIQKTPGDAKAGALVFKKVCAQCHKIYGDGVEVGPDVTANGRSDFDQLLSNVFDPSLVIGAGYQATTVTTQAGQVITGLVVEESPQRLVLKVQGGEVKTIPRSEIDEVTVSKVSLMPEGLERQMQTQEIVDLFAFLCLDRPPDDPKARKIPGTPK
jgi:putative membrane-bound dehydrogenase-like protein